MHLLSGLMPVPEMKTGLDAWPSCVGDGGGRPVFGEKFATFIVYTSAVFFSKSSSVPFNNYLNFFGSIVHPVQIGSLHWTRRVDIRGQANLPAPMHCTPYRSYHVANYGVHEVITHSKFVCRSRRIIVNHQQHDISSGHFLTTKAGRNARMAE